MSKVGFQRSLNIATYAFFFFLKQMVLVTVEESTRGMTCAFGLIYSCALGCLFQSLPFYAINYYFSLPRCPVCRTRFSDLASKHGSAGRFQ